MIRKSIICFIFLIFTQCKTIELEIDKFDLYSKLRVRNNPVDCRKTLPLFGGGREIYCFNDLKYILIKIDGKLNFDTCSYYGSYLNIYTFDKKKLTFNAQCSYINNDSIKEFEKNIPQHFNPININNIKEIKIRISKSEYLKRKELVNKINNS